jgi:hypothetical protein
MLYANFYAIRRMEHYAVRAYFYQQLVVAYDIGKTPAVKQQLSKMISENKYPRQKAMAGEIEGKLADMKDPGTVLNGLLEREREGLTRMKIMREAAFVLLILLIFVRVLFGRKEGSINI